MGDEIVLILLSVWAIWWKLNNAETRVRPVHVSVLFRALQLSVTYVWKVMDVAQALANLLNLPKVSGVVNLPGPSTLTYQYLLDMVSSVTLRPPSKAPTVPKAVAEAIASVGKTEFGTPAEHGQFLAGKCRRRKLHLCGRDEKSNIFIIPVRTYQKETLPQIF